MLCTGSTPAWQSVTQTPPVPQAFTWSPASPNTSQVTWSPPSIERRVPDPARSEIYIGNADTTVALARLQWKLEREELTRKREMLLQEIASMKNSSAAQSGVQLTASPEQHIQAEHSNQKDQKDCQNEATGDIDSWRHSGPDVSVSEPEAESESKSSILEGGSLEKEFKALRSRKRQLLQELAAVQGPLQGPSLDMMPDQKVSEVARNSIREEIQSLSCRRAGLLREIAVLQAKQKPLLQEMNDLEDNQILLSESQQRIDDALGQSSRLAGIPEPVKNSSAEGEEKANSDGCRVPAASSRARAREQSPCRQQLTSLGLGEFHPPYQQGNPCQQGIEPGKISLKDAQDQEQKNSSRTPSKQSCCEHVSQANQGAATSLSDPCVQTLVGFLKKGLTEYDPNEVNVDSKTDPMEILPFAPFRDSDCIESMRKATGSTRSGTPRSAVEEITTAPGVPPVVQGSKLLASERPQGHRRSLVSLPASQIQESLRLLRPQQQQAPPRQHVVGCAPSPPLRPRRSPSPPAQSAREPSPPARSVLKRDRSPQRSTQETRGILQVFLDPSNNMLAMLRAAEGLMLESLPVENVENLRITGLCAPNRSFLRILGTEGSSRGRLQFAWHLAGSAEAADEIQAEGIRCDEHHCSCGRYGRGGYVATSAAKANAYADSEGSGGERYLFLVLALPGEEVALGKRGLRPSCTAADHSTHPTEFCFIDQSRLHCACRLDYCWVPSGRRMKEKTVGNHVRAWRATSPASPKAAPRRLRWRMNSSEAF